MGWYEKGGKNNGVRFWLVYLDTSFLLFSRISYTCFSQRPNVLDSPLRISTKFEIQIIQYNFFSGSIASPRIHFSEP